MRLLELAKKKPLKCKTRDRVFLLERWSCVLLGTCLDGDPPVRIPSTFAQERYNNLGMFSLLEPGWST